MKSNILLLIIAALSIIFPVSETISMERPDSLDAEKLYKKADAFWRDVKYDSSNFYYEKATALFEKDSMWQRYIDCQKNMGMNYRYLGNYSQAIVHLNKGLEYVTKLNDNQDSLRAELYNSIGTIYYEKKNYDKAYKYYRDMLDINKRIFGTEHTNTGKAYQNVGLIYYRNGDLDKAIQYFEKAISIWDSTLSKDNPLLANCYTNMSEVYFLKEEYPRSIEFDEKALKIWVDKLGEGHPFVAQSYNNLASTYSCNGNYNKALEYDFKAVQIRKDLGGEESRDMAYSYASIGEVFIKMDNLNNGKFFLDKSIAIYKKVDPSNPGLSEAYTFAGNMYRKKILYKTAEAYYDSALYVVWPGYDPGNINADDAVKIPAEEQLITTLFEKGNTYCAEAEQSPFNLILEKALNAYTLAAAVIEKLKANLGAGESKTKLIKRSYVVNKKGVLTAIKLFTLTNNPDYIESAFQFAEGSKAGILAETIAKSNYGNFAGIPDSLISEEKDLQADLALYETKLKEAGESNNVQTTENQRTMLLESRRKYDELLNYFKQNFASYYKLKHPLKLPSTAEIRKLLPPDAALVEYFTGDTTVTIFVLTQTSMNAVTVICDSVFFNEVRKFRESLQRLNYMNYLASASELYSKLIAPVKIFLGDKKKLYIIPDDIFTYLPFEALLTKHPPAPFNGKFIRLPYLINDYEISYHYSAELLRETLLNNNNAPMSFAGFAPVFSDDKNAINQIASVIDTNLINYDPLRSIKVSGKKYASLPETETEVKSIGELFREHEYLSHIFTGKASTVSELKSDKMNGYKFIHLATHGFLNEEHPGLSGLVFYNSGDSADNGILFAGDIYNLNLNADLIVLSACESGIGKVVKGEGIISLIRSFLYGGTDNIVVSLWQTAGQSTSVLMINFYKNILEGMDYSSALRKAKLDMIRGEVYSYPLDWSPFILVGR
jgi:CHAT domain-containing protein